MSALAAFDTLPAAPQTFSTARLIGKLTRGVEDAAIVVCSDSTGALLPTDNWVYLMAQALAAAYPAYTVELALWSDGSAAYASATTIQSGSGSQTLRIWNASVSGKSLMHNITRMQSQIVVKSPDLIIISHGHNQSGTTTAARDRRMAEMLNLTEWARSRVPQASIMLVAQNLRNSSYGAGWDENLYTAARWERVAQMRGFGFVDIAQAWADQGDYSGLMADATHPNAAGHQLWWATMAPHFQPIRGQVPRGATEASFDVPGTNLLTNGDFSTVTPVATTTYLSDGFTRTGSPGWDTPDTGPAWTHDVASAFSTNGTKGICSVDTANVYRSAYNDLTSSLADQRVTFSVSLDQLPTGATAYAWAELRRQDADNYYEARVNVLTTGVVQASVTRKLAGTGTTLVGGTTVSGITYTAGTVLWCRAEVIGTTIRVWVWEDGGSASASPNITTTNSDITTAGGVGIGGATSTGLTSLPMVFTFDSIAIVNATDEVTVGSWTATGCTLTKDFDNVESPNGYSIRLTGTAAPNLISQTLGGTVVDADALRPFLGRTITLAARILVPSGPAVSTAGALVIATGVNDDRTSSGCGGYYDLWHWQVVTKTVELTASTVRVDIYGDASNSGAQVSVDRVMLCTGSLPRDVP